jgi:replicative DNA helicase
VSLEKEIKSFLKSKNLKIITWDENLMVDCPLCGEDDRNRLGIHAETGKWQSFCCDRKGMTFDQYKKAINNDKVSNKKMPTKIGVPKPEYKLKEVKINPKLADKYFSNIKKSTRKALSYLKKERGFSSKAIKFFKLGSRMKNSKERLAVPYFEDGRCVNLKYRTLEKAPTKKKELKKYKKWKWTREPGGRSSLFNDQVLSTPHLEYVVILEAELDCISLWDNGEKKCVSLTTGTGKFQQYWYDRLTHVKKIYVCMDNDLPGQDGALKLCKRLGLDRCFNVILPDGINDVNDFFWNSDKQKRRLKLEDFQQVLKEAKQFEVPDIVSLKDVYKTLYQQKFVDDQDAIKGLDTPWKKINGIMGGVKDGYLVVICARPKVGKSTLALNWLVYLGNEGYSTLMVTCEMRPERLGDKTIQMNAKNFTTVEEITEIQIAEANYKMPSKSTYFYYPQFADLDLDKVCDKITEAVQRYGLKAVCFDNLDFLCRGFKDTADRIGTVTQRFKMLAENLDIIFILISHPKKVGHNKPLSTEDPKGSAAILQDLDVLLLMHREIIDPEESADLEDDFNSGTMSDLTEINIFSRWSEGGKCYLSFNGERALFKDSGIGYDTLVRSRYEKLKKKNKNRERRS